MRMLFVDPFGDEEAIGLNMGIAYCAANLRKHGHSVSVLDMNTIRSGNADERLREAVNKGRPDAVGFSVMSMSFYNSVKLANDLRSYFNGLIIFGGAEISAQKEKVFTRANSVDIVVIGEAEKTLVEIADHFDNGRINELEDVRGIIWKREGAIVTNPVRGIEADLGSLPFPDYEVFGVNRMNHYLLLTSRSCPFNCSFCFSYVPRWRSRDAEKCIEELKYTIEKYDIKVFQICDPCFNANIKRVEDFCDALIREGIRLPWYAMGVRADRVTDRMAGKMRESGCRRVWIGIESMHEEVFKNIGKGETIQDIKNGIKIFKDNGIQVYGYLVMGLPGDTLKRTLYSYEEAQKLDLNVLAFSSAVPFSGTKLEKWVADGNARMLADPLTISSIGSKYHDIAYETDDFPLQERVKARFILNVKAQAYYDPTLPKWLFLIKKIYSVLRYDFKNIFHRIRKSIQYRRNRKHLDKIAHAQFVYFGRIPDGTWALSPDERPVYAREEVNLNLKIMG